MKVLNILPYSRARIYRVLLNYRFVLNYNIAILSNKYNIGLVFSIGYNSICAVSMRD